MAGQSRGERSPRARPVHGKRSAARAAIASAVATSRLDREAAARSEAALATTPARGQTPAAAGVRQAWVRAVVAAAAGSAAVAVVGSVAVAAVVAGGRKRGGASPLS